MILEARRDITECALRFILQTLQLFIISLVPKCIHTSALDAVGVDLILSDSAIGDNVSHYSARLANANVALLPVSVYVVTLEWKSLNEPASATNLFM